MLDIVSYLLGVKKGGKNVVIDGDGYTYSDPDGKGNIVVEKEETSD